MNPRRGLGIGVVWSAAAILVAAAFLILNIDRLHMHPDEELSYRATAGGVIDTLRWQIDLEDNQAPLWFLTFNLWRAFVGDAEFTSRALGVLLILPALALIARMARRAFGGAAGVFTPLVLVGSGLFFQYALDIRMYPLVMLVSAVSAALLWRWLRLRTISAALWYGLSAAVMLYTHYLLIFLLVGHGLFFLLARRPDARLLRQGMAAAGVMTLAFLPWLPVAVTQINHLRAVEAETGTARGGIGIGVSTLLTSPENVQALLDFATNSQPILYGALLTLGMALATLRKTPRRGRELMLLALIWALVVPAIYLLVNTRAGVYAPRYVSFLALGLAVAVGGALALAPIPRLVRWGALACLIALNLQGFPATLPARIPYRDIFQAVSAASLPGDAVLFVRAGEDEGFVRWQIDHYLDADLRTGATANPALAQGSRRVWLITGDWFDEATRAVFETLEPGHPVQRVIGQCDRAWCYLAQLMEAPPLDQPVLFNGDLGFWGMDFDRAARDAVSVRLWWRVERSIPRDLSFSLRLLTVEGAMVAQQDGAILHYGQDRIETSVMQPGALYIDRRALTLSPPLPPGDYALALIVYQSWDGVRWTLPDGGDTLNLGAIRIE
ncbi:MAG: glycosyltransferase family 39 protein [Anaerolineae bacterium]|nr:glycosyltransferase family 39 protein [Anaerolineae bacterium]NUQ03400.1 glycosyltransferase family 39 protein [Anaerolineae bacterium]